MKRALSLGLCAAAFAVLGCGDPLAGSDYPGPELARLRGQLAGSGTSSTTGAVSFPIEVSFAIVWQPNGDNSPWLSPEHIVPSGGTAPAPELDDAYPGWIDLSLQCTREPLESDAPGDSWRNAVGQQTEPVSYEDQFPIQFEIPLNHVPPASERLDLGRYGGTGTAAVGVIVAYEDLDGDGTITRGRPGVLGDRILAASVSTRTRLIYLEGSLSPSGPQLPRGYWIVSNEGHRFVRVTPLSEGLTLNMDAPADPYGVDPPKETLACEAESKHIGRFQPGPPPPGATIHCTISNRRQYAWTFASIQDCEWTQLSGVACMSESDPIPAGWPCP